MNFFNGAAHHRWNFHFFVPWVFPWQYPWVYPCHEFSHANQTLWVPWIFPCNLLLQWAHDDVGDIGKLRGSCKNINRVTMSLPPFCPSEKVKVKLCWKYISRSPTIWNNAWQCPAKQYVSLSSWAFIPFPFLSFVIVVVFLRCDSIAQHECGWLILTTNSFRFRR